MDALSLLLAALLSPLVMIIAAVVVVAAAKNRSLQKPKVATLVQMSLVFALIGAGGSLMLVFAWMRWYEATAGYDAGNAPVAWIFFYGPLSAALGQLLALVTWWFRKPPAPALGR